MGRLDDGGPADIDHQPDRNRIIGFGQSGGKRDASAIFAGIVSGRPAANRDRSIHYHAVRRISLEKCRQIDKGLERRTRLPLGICGPVELAVFVVAPADDRFYRAFGRHGHRGGLAEPVARPFRVDDVIENLLGRRLQFHVNRCLDLDDEIAEQTLLLEERDRLFVGPIEEPVGAVETSLRNHRRGLAPCLQEFALGDEARIEHAVEHDIGAGLCRFHVLVRRIFRWRLEQAGQHRRFREIDVADGFAEIELRRRFHAVVAAAQIGAVEIELQDFLL